MLNEFFRDLGGVFEGERISDFKTAISLLMSSYELALSGARYPLFFLVSVTNFLKSTVGRWIGRDSYANVSRGARENQLHLRLAADREL